MNKYFVTTNSSLISSSIAASLINQASDTSLYAQVLASSLSVYIAFSQPHHHLLLCNLLLTSHGSLIHSVSIARYLPKSGNSSVTLHSKSSNIPSISSSCFIRFLKNLLYTHDPGTASIPFSTSNPQSSHNCQHYFFV